jgi:hypothetical protein
MDNKIFSKKLGGGGLYPPADLLPYFAKIGKTTKFIESGTNIKNHPSKSKNLVTKSSIKLKMVKKVIP